MRSRPDPQPPDFDRRVHQETQFKAAFKEWADELDPGSSPEELDPAHYDMIRDLLILRAGGTNVRDRYERHRTEMMPVLAFPEIDDKIGDFQLIWTLPEMVDFWRDLQPDLKPANSGQQRGGMAPNFDGPKAVLMFLP
jgi:hypothetical protein